MECEDAANDHSYEPYSASNRTGADGAGYKDNRHNPYSHSEDSYAFCECESSTYTTSSLAASVVVEQTKYEHHCAGCVSGIYRNRKIPLSKLDASTGSTNSSSGKNGATWSFISGESGRYQDRDEGFVPTTENRFTPLQLDDGQNAD